MLLVLVISFLCLTESICEEPRCSSFDFEKKLLEMLVRIEFKLDGEINTREENGRLMMERINLLMAADQELKATDEQLNAADEQLKATDEQLKATDEQLKAVYEQLKETDEQLKATDEQLKAVYEQLRETDEQLKATDEQLIATDDQLNATTLTEIVSKGLKDIEESVRTLEERATDVDAFQAYSNMTLEELKATDQQLKSYDQDILANLTVPPVYFLVKVANYQLNGVTPSFTKVIDNLGDSYDVSTGLFTCRVQGLYNFAFSYVSESDSDHSICRLRKNGDDHVFAYGKGDRDSSSIVAYLYLGVGDTVDIRCSNWDMVAHSSTGTYFSGALIRK